MCMCALTNVIQDVTVYSLYFILVINTFQFILMNMLNFFLDISYSLWKFSGSKAINFQYLFRLSLYPKHVNNHAMYNGVWCESYLVLDFFLFQMSEEHSSSNIS